MNLGNRNFFHPEKAVSGRHCRMEKVDTDLVLDHSQEESYAAEGHLEKYHGTGESW